MKEKAMKKVIILIISIMCANYSTAQSTDNNSNQNQQPKTLVVYYSWSGNTQAVARQIQSLTNGDIFEIKPVKPYPKDYNECILQAKKEIKDGYKPPIADTVKNISQYDAVFVGSPNWWSTIAPPVATFLSQHDLSSKTVIPFCTHGGGRQANLFKDIAKLCSNSTMQKGFVVDGSTAHRAKSDVQKWLRDLGIIKY
ncbi:MAG: NAD(P)H dehydrogenase (quinone) [Candidatus Ordinivivax streblomastigis]|uniref:NAD(P)H dehydrogenase (Quinone) n=1 Tax=Candidatus Ordinivivax streblomastigis TaxID=2540710 RepID=A0A5M8NXN8_9BACT|nr:MAG: NAD(P)H dehydrogenase (quinone) [Candidatus Ordinivivax streblomastigis]